MQCVLLTATVLGLSVSLLSQPIEVEFARCEFRDMVGGGLWPQAVLRFGYGSKVPRTQPC